MSAPNRYLVQLHGSPPAVTNVGVGTMFLYVGEGERDFPTIGTRLTPVPTGTVLRIAQKVEGIHNCYYELRQNSDGLYAHWLSAAKLAEMINNDLLLEVPQAACANAFLKAR